MKKIILGSLLGLCLSCFLVGCGQKGDLYLPAPPITSNPTTPKLLTPIAATPKPSASNPSTP